MSNEQDNASAIESIEHELYDPKAKMAEVKIHGAKRHKEVNLPTSWGEDSSIITRGRDTSGMSFGAKLLILSTILLIAAVCFSAWRILSSKNIISANNIELTVDVESLVQGGEATPLVATLHNNNTVPLESARLTLLYKQGNGSQDEQEKVQEKRNIGIVKPGEYKKQDFSLLMYGGEAESRTINLKLEYKIAGSNAVFSKVVTTSVTLKSPSVTVSIEGKDKMASGQSGSFMFVVKNTAATSSLPSVLQVIFPNSFVIENAAPKPIARSTSWQIGSIKPGESKAVEITGYFNGSQGELGTFQAKVGSQGDLPTSIGVVYSAKTKDVTLQPSPLTLGISLSGSGGEIIRYGDKVVLMMKYSNGSGQALENVSFKVSLAGDATLYDSVDPLQGMYSKESKTVVWNKSNLPELAVLAPNAQGVVQISVPIVQRGNNTPSLKVTFEGLASASDAGDVAATVTKTWNVVSSATVDATTQYKNTNLQNTGPIPPVVGKETSYTGVFKVTAQSALSMARISFVLPTYVAWKGATSNVPGITYNVKSRTIYWEIGPLEQGKVALTEIGLVLKPSLGQVDQKPTLTSTIVLDAEDALTKMKVKTTLSPLTTSLYNEEWPQNPAIVTK
jgi:hypothetical protein